MRRKLKEMVVVITGASAGIGRALAVELAASGAKLALVARRVDRLEELNASLGGGHLCIGADVSRTNDCRNLIERTVERFGRIDTLVCNAGFGIYQQVARTTPEQAREIFATNVFGTTDAIHFALPIIAGQERRDGIRGQIMIVSSCVARRGVPFIGMYSATKAAQLALAEALRVELRPLRIAVTSVHPIQTKTEFGQAAQTRGQIKLLGAPIGQTAETVARRMIAAIERPKREVWPSRPSRLIFGLATLMPGAVDHVMSRYRRKVEAMQRM